jgi:putative hemolysin
MSLVISILTYRVNDQQRERISETGKLIIIANHPIGTLDGLALIKCVKEIMQRGTQKKNIQNINLHLRNEGALIVFPAGEVSRLRPHGIRDTKWQGGKVAKWFFKNG